MTTIDRALDTSAAIITYPSPSRAITDSMTKPSQKYLARISDEAGVPDGNGSTMSKTSLDLQIPEVDLSSSRTLPPICEILKRNGLASDLRLEVPSSPWRESLKKLTRLPGGEVTRGTMAPPIVHHHLPIAV
ncbi:hypothetical protein FGB62_11g227 [Gracilaria domingensis]|nr:hypothetical protein FGB62_11g227 [Gracilaria domingensis]